ncbi:hypothetical protein C8A03DRAFT_48164 [Achaetomium macrosporum]|uniref:AA1-like domain-containing protein n=1 Tax=Achaetomium macrosporum TaxID=79813 RepID=A0AAN7C0X9_9PEZI|nr:hypothetical protein C8A03DRAFT_48164 [Achaetomium macrosporum]
MHLSIFYGLSSLSFTLAQTIPGVTMDTCPTSAPGPSHSLPGWDLTNYLYVVYDERRQGGDTAATARIRFDLVGGFTNHAVHCEAAGPEFLANYTAPTSINMWRTCVSRAGNLTSGYTTMFRYRPSDPWDKLTLRETASCGTDPKQIRGVLFKGEVTANYFVTGQGDRPEAPPGGSNVETWTRTYYNDYHVPGSFTLIDPAPSANCTPGPPAWEVHGFSFSESCCSPPPLFGLPNVGWDTQFRLANLANNYTVGCSGHSNLSDASNSEWHICGLDPEDAPWLPATLFCMDRKSHLLKVNQTWVCNTSDQSM